MGIVTIAQTGEQFDCAAGQSLLSAMRRPGRRGIPAGCLGGGCGVCKIRILRGEIATLGPTSRAHVSRADECAGYALACRATPQGDVELEVAGAMQKPFFSGFGRPAGPVTTR